MRAWGAAVILVRSAACPTGLRSVLGVRSSFWSVTFALSFHCPIAVCTPIAVCSVA
jgi:hypothetical protein